MESVVQISQIRTRAEVSTIVGGVGGVCRWRQGWRDRAGRRRDDLASEAVVHGYHKYGPGLGYTETGVIVSLVHARAS